MAQLGAYFTGPEIDGFAKFVFPTQWEKLDEELQSNYESARKFCSFFKKIENSLFDDIRRDGIKKHFSWEEYVKYVEKKIEAFKLLLTNQQDSIIQAKLESTIRTLTKQLALVHECLHFFKDDEKMTFASYLAQAVKMKKPIRAAFQEFRELAHSIRLLNGLEMALSLLKESSRYTKVFYIVDVYNSKLLFDSVRELNVEGSYHGRVIEPSHLHLSPLPICDVNQKSRLSIKVIQPSTHTITSPTFHRNQLIELLHKAYTRWTNPRVIEHFKDVLKDNVEEVCLSCKQKDMRYDLYQLIATDRFYCCACLARHLLAEYAALDILQSSSPLSEKEKIFLKRCAALCYFQSIIFAPYVTSSARNIYSLPHTHSCSHKTDYNYFGRNLEKSS